MTFEIIFLQEDDVMGHIRGSQFPSHKLLSGKVSLDFEVSFDLGKVTATTSQPPPFCMVPTLVVAYYSCLENEWLDRGGEIAALSGKLSFVVSSLSPVGSP